MISFGSSHTNGELETITYNKKTISYKKIFYLDNKMKLDEIYTILHNKDNYGSDVAFVLNSDLDFSEVKDYSELNNNLTLTKYKTGQDTFLPIGGIYNDNDNINSAGGENEFNASFYGNNHKIIVGDINYSDEDNVGFFGVIGSSGKVYDLKLEIGNVSGRYYVGGFAGINDGTIENSSAVVDSINGDSHIGGFVGYNNNNRINRINKGTIENSSAVVNSVKGDDYNIGGFVGQNDGEIENSSVVIVSVKGRRDIGGFVGQNDGEIENSSTVVDSVKGIKSVGGFAGWSFNGKIKKSSTIVNSISYEKWTVGVFAGYANGTIENSVARVLVLNGASSSVNAGYYLDYNSVGNSTEINNKQKFFFGNNSNNSENKGLSYDGITLTITSPTDTEYNDTNYRNYNDTIMTNLSKYWNKWDKKNS